MKFLAILEHDDAPSHRPEHAVNAVKQPIRYDAVQALAVVIDDPPDVSHVVLPALEKSFKNIALIQFRVADQRNQASGRSIPWQPLS